MNIHTSKYCMTASVSGNDKWHDADGNYHYRVVEGADGQWRIQQVSVSEQPQSAHEADITRELLGELFLGGMTCLEQILHWAHRSDTYVLTPRHPATVASTRTYLQHRMGVTIHTSAKICEMLQDLDDGELKVQMLVPGPHAQRVALQIPASKNTKLDLVALAMA